MKNPVLNVPLDQETLRIEKSAQGKSLHVHNIHIKTAGRT